MFPSHGAAGSATDFDGAPSRAARPLARRRQVGRWTPRPARLGFRVADLARVHAFGHAMLRCDGEQAVADGAPLSRLGGHVAVTWRIAQNRARLPGAAASQAAGPAASGTRLVDPWLEGPQIVDAPDD